MKDDGHIGGWRYVIAVDQVEVARTGATSDIHFTFLSFTSGTSEAIMCTIIMKSNLPVSDIPISWTLGINVSKDMCTGNTLVETHNNNLKAGVSIGCPKCTFNGKDVPCFVCTSPIVSITSDLLADIAQSEEDSIPFLLINGHHSRTRLPFLT
jgi:hypothetical protein